MSNIILAGDFWYPIEKTCFITGHRPQSIGSGWEDHATHDICKQALKRLLLKAKMRGFQYVISGMAVGTDLWAAQMLVEDPDLKPLLLIAAVPFPGQEKRWMYKTQEVYRDVLLLAHDSYTISMVDPIPENEKVSQKDWASIMLLRRNEWMVNNASLGIGIYDGKRSGGTFKAIEYALKKKKIVCTYNPVSGEYKRHDIQTSLIQL